MTAKRRPRVVVVSDFASLWEELDKVGKARPDTVVFEDVSPTFFHSYYQVRTQAMIKAQDYARLKGVALWFVVPSRASVSTALLACGVKIVVGSEIRSAIQFVVGSEIRSAIQWWPEYERLCAAQRKKEIAHVTPEGFKVQYGLPLKSFSAKSQKGGRV